MVKEKWIFIYRAGCCAIIVFLLRQLRIEAPAGCTLMLLSFCCSRNAY